MFLEKNSSADFLSVWKFSIPFCDASDYVPECQDLSLKSLSLHRDADCKAWTTVVGRWCPHSA